MTENMIKRPPSYYRYKKEHPTVSFILNRELKEALDILKETKSYGQIMKQIIEGKIDEKMAKKIKELENEVLKKDKQLEFLRNLQWFDVPCRRCGQPVSITSNTDKWNTEIYPVLREIFINAKHPWNCLEEK